MTLDQGKVEKRSVDLTRKILDVVQDRKETGLRMVQKNYSF